MASFNTGKIRFSYPNVFKPKAAGQNQTEKYSITALIPKSDKETLDKLAKACRELYEENKNSKFKGLEYDEVAKPYHDGDGRKPKGGSYGPECKGCIVLGTSSINKPVVVDGVRQPVTDERMVYAGCYGRLNVNLYAFNVNGNRGIAAGLNGVQTYNYGQAIGGYFSADGFDDGFVDNVNDDDDLGL